MKKNMLSCITAIVGSLTAFATNLNAEEKCANQVKLEGLAAERFFCIEPATLAALIKAKKGTNSPVIVPEGQAVAAADKTCESGMIRIVKVEAPKSKTEGPVDPEVVEL